MVLIIIKVLACIEKYYSWFFSSKKWAEFEMKKWIIRVSAFDQFGGWGTMGNEGSLSRCGGFVLAKPELCFLEIPFLDCTGLEIWKVKAKGPRFHSGGWRGLRRRLTCRRRGVESGPSSPGLLQPPGIGAPASAQLCGEGRRPLCKPFAS